MLVMSRVRVEVTRIPGRSWLIHANGHATEVERFASVTAAALNLVAHSAPVDLVVMPDRCDRCGEPIYLANPESADEIGEIWRTLSGRPICSTELRRINR